VTPSGRAALLFDLDGTLTDNSAGIVACIRHALAATGAADPGAAALRACIGPPLRETFAHLLSTADTERVELALAHYRERYRDIGWRENAPYPGIDAALSALATAGARLVLCTSKPEVYARRILAHFELDRHFSAQYGADLAGKLDDKRALLAHILAREDLDAAGSTLVGDRHHDVRAARAHGLRAIGVLWGFGGRDELSGADALVDSPEQLAGVLATQRSA
jgi:phosphoglycolate phosphatase